MVQPTGVGRTKTLLEISVMQILKISVAIPDATPPNGSLRMCNNDADCNVVIALPMQAARAPQVVQLGRDFVGTPSPADDYRLGGYAGI